MPLFWLCIAFILGLFSSAFFVFPEFNYPLTIILFLIGSWLERHLSEPEHHPLLSHRLFRIPFCLLAMFFILGSWRFQMALPDFSEDDLSWYSENNSVSLIGVVDSYPQESSSATTAIIKARSIALNGKTVEIKGKMEIRLPAGFNLSYGDVLLLEGSLEPVPESESKPFQSYLARKGVHSRMYYPNVRTLERDGGNWLIRWIYGLRKKNLQIIYDHIPFPSSALLAGILLGIDWNIPAVYQEAYRSCGLIHIIAISGFNIALISNVIIKIARLFLPAGKAGIAAVSAITFYTILVGAEPAVVRAALMGSLTIPTYFLGRRAIPIHNLILVGALMLIGNPFLLWDVGFQLSFLACLGLITMVNPFENLICEKLKRVFSESVSRFWQPITSLVSATLVAQFAVMPVILEMEPSLSLSTLAANLAVLPVQPMLMWLGALFVITSWLPPFLSRISFLFSRAVWPFLAYSNQLALHFGFSTGTNIEVSSSSRGIVAILVPLVLLIALVFHILQIERTPNNGPNDQR